MPDAPSGGDRIGSGTEATGEEQDLMGLLQAVGVGFTFVALVVVVIVVASVLYSAVKVIKEYERGVIFRLGRVQGGPKGPGLFLLLPLVDSMVKIDLRTVTMDVPPRT